MASPLSDGSRVAWVVGAGGIGSAVAEALSGRFALVVFDRESGDRSRPVVLLDAVNSSSVRDAVEETAAKHGIPEVVVYCVGYVSAATVESVTVAELHRIIDHNFTGLIYFLQALRRILRSAPCTCLVVTSNAAFVARPDQPLYAAMKAAVASLVKSLAAGWAASGIRLVAVAPGTVIVDRNRDAVLRRYPDAPHDGGRPSGRLLLPADLASFIADLTDHCDQLTGQTLIFDGGSSLGGR